MLDIRRLVRLILVLVEGLWRLLQEARTFEELEEGVHHLTQQLAGQVLGEVLKGLDERLLRDRERRWEVVGKRTRRLLTRFGEVVVERRLYRDRGTGRSVFLLDETLGWPARERWSPGLKRLAVRLATSVSYREAAECLRWLVPGVSKQAVWALVQKVGAAAQAEAAARRRQFHELGEAPCGRYRAERIRLEADGTLVNLQGFKGKKKELKLFTAYEKKAMTGRGRRQLMHRRVWATLADAEPAWEESAVEVAEQWSMEALKQIELGGDGAAWIQQGAAYFPGVQTVLHLDRFHLHRALRWALGHDEEGYRAVAEGIAERQWGRIERALTEAQKRVRGGSRQRIEALARYLRANWAGIRDLSEDERLGVMEGLMRHVITKRMKRQNARWSERGGETMARLRAAYCNGELEEVARPRSWQRRLQTRPLVGTSPFRPAAAEQIREAAEVWLKVRMPALTGPHAARPWVRIMLKELSQLPSFIA